MPPKKRKSIGQISTKSKQMKQQRAAETTRQRDTRLYMQRVRQAETRATETTVERNARLQDLRERAKISRAVETTRVGCEL